jgi:hypothetical protein
MRISFLFSFFLNAFIFGSAESQSFHGKIEYNLHEGYGSKSFCTYFFNENYIKKVDTSSENLFVKAGFSEVVWNIKEGKQYIVNHGTQTVYSIHYKTGTSLPVKHEKVEDIILETPCHVYERSEINPLEFKDKPDTMISKGIYYIPESGFSVIPAGGISKFDPLNLLSGLIPLRIKNSGGLTSSPENGYSNKIEAVSILTRKIPDDFFQLPLNYKMKDYSEKEVKWLVGEAAKKQIDFMEMAKKEIRKKYVYFSFD